MDRQELRRLFDTFQDSAFRLETLQRYTVPEEAEALAAFEAGRPLPPRTVENSPMLRLVADATAVGKRMYRVHVMDRPLTTYLRLELLGYEGNAAAGEEVYIADRGAHPDLMGLTEDFWLFDDQVVVRMHYDGEGHFLGVERGLGTELEKYRHRRDLALAHAVPLADYVAAEGQRRA